MVAPGGHVWLLCLDVHGCLEGGILGCSWGGMCGCSRGAYLVAPKGGVCGCFRGACMVAPGGHVWLLPGSMHGCSRGHAWDTMRYRDTINERVVHILLECILVKTEYCSTVHNAHF